MFENLYTTKMSASKKTLQNRFAKIRAKNGRIANVFSAAMLIFILTTMLYATVVMAAMNEQKTAPPTDGGGAAESVVPYLPQNKLFQKGIEKGIQNLSEVQTDSFGKENLITGSAEIEKIKPQPANNNDAESVTDKKRIKSSFVSDEPYVGLEQIVLPNINSAEIQNELQNNGVVASKNELVDLKSEYFVSDSPVGMTKVNADKNGNISIYMSVELDNLFNVNITDSETGENIEQAVILADNDNIYTFLGYEQGKSYDVEVTSQTQNDWDIKGNYIIY